MTSKTNLQLAKEQKFSQNMLKIFETVAQKSLNKEISRKTPTSAVRNRKDKRMKKMVSQKREQQKKDNCKEK